MASILRTRKGYILAGLVVMLAVLVGFVTTNQVGAYDQPCSGGEYSDYGCAAVEYDATPFYDQCFSLQGDICYACYYSCDELPIDTCSEDMSGEVKYCGRGGDFGPLRDW